MIKIFLLLTFTLILCVLLVSTAVAESGSLVWETEPKWNEVKYSWGTFYYNASFDIQTWEPFVFDTQTRDFYAAPGWDDLWGGGADDAYLYDEAKRLYGNYGGNYDMYFSGMLSPDDFIEKYGNKLRAFRKINSNKINSNHLDEYGMILRGDFLSEAYIGDKYALAYGTIFVTNFIYDYSIVWLYRNDRDNAIAVKLNGKWGAIGKDGEALTPFIFDDLIFIDDNTAFAKYNGKYGILDIKETSFSLVGVNYSPQTGEKSVIYLVILLSISVILINYKNKSKNKI